MQIIMDTWLFVAILSLLFLVGVISGIRIAYTKITIKLLKRLKPEEFEKLLEGKDEGGEHSAISSGCLHKQSEGETPKHKIPSR